MKKRNKGRRLTDASSPKPSMAAMIDVVFLLLVFFLVAVDPSNVLAKLDVSRPEISSGDDTKVTLRIGVAPDFYTVDGRKVSESALLRLLNKVEELRPDIAVVVTCDARSEHSRLITVLDTCQGAGLKDISLVSKKNAGAASRP
jgi:biopolymer transport protein ExbD